jgi:hypothetical protein
MSEQNNATDKDITDEKENTNEEHINQDSIENKVKEAAKERNDISRYDSKIHTPECVAKSNIRGETGVKLKELESGGVVVLPVSSYAEGDSENKITVHTTKLHARSIAQGGLPVSQANLRKPDGTREVVDTVKQSIQQEPEKLSSRHSGLCIVASSAETIENEEGAVTHLVLGFRENEGLYDGGHSYLAAQKAQAELDDDSILSIGAEFPAQIVVLDIEDEKEREEELTNIAIAQNLNNEVEIRSKLEKLEYWSLLKENISDSKIISWREGQTDVRPHSDEPKVLLNIAEALHPLRHKSKYCDNNDYHTQAVSRSGTPRRVYEKAAHARWGSAPSDSVDVKDPLLEQVLPILDQMLALRDGFKKVLTETDRNNPDHVRLAEDDGLRGTSIFKYYIKNNDGSIPTQELQHPRWRGYKGVNIDTRLLMSLIGWLRSTVWLPENIEQRSKLAGWYRDPLGNFEDYKFGNLRKASGAIDNWEKAQTADFTSNLVDRLTPAINEVSGAPDIISDLSDDVTECYVRTDSDREYPKNAELLVQELGDSNDTSHILTPDDEIIKEDAEKKDEYDPSDLDFYCKVNWLDTTYSKESYNE